MTSLQPRAIIGLTVCYIVSGAIALVLGFFGTVSVETAVQLPASVPAYFAGIFLISYFFGAGIGAVTMIGSATEAWKVFVPGALSACATAWAAGFYLGGHADRGLRIAALAPAAVSVLITSVIVNWRGLSTTSFGVAAGLKARARKGRTAVAAWSLVVFAAGYVWVLAEPGPDHAVIGLIASGVSIFLAARSLPNAMAIIALVSSALFILNLLTSPLSR